MGWAMGRELAWAMDWAKGRPLTGYAIGSAMGWAAGGHPVGQ